MKKIITILALLFCLESQGQIFNKKQERYDDWPFTLEFIKVGQSIDSVLNWMKGMKTTQEKKALVYTKRSQTINPKTREVQTHIVMGTEKLWTITSRNENHAMRHNMYEYHFDPNTWICVRMEVTPDNNSITEKFLLSNSFTKTDTSFLSSDTRVNIVVKAGKIIIYSNPKIELIPSKMNERRIDSLSKAKNILTKPSIQQQQQPIIEQTQPDTRKYYTGAKGGCYYYSNSGKKVYVDKSYCK